jgi:hypothetical protein
MQFVKKSSMKIGVSEWSTDMSKKSQAKPSTRPVDPVVVAKERGVVLREQARKPTRRGRGEPQQARAPPDQLAFSIEQFCQAHAFSVSMFFKLKAQGLGPRVIKLGTRTLITAEAAREWREARAAETAAAAAVQATAAAGTTIPGLHHCRDHPPHRPAAARSAPRAKRRTERARGAP